MTSSAITDARIYPTLSEAATLVGVAGSTLSRRDDIQAIPAGDRDLRIPVSEVLRLAQHYRRQGVDEVVHALLARAGRLRLSRAAMKAFDREIEAAQTALYRAHRPESISTFIRDAQRLLPAELYVAVAQAVLPAESTPTRTRASAGTSPARGKKRRVASPRAVRQPA